MDKIIPELFESDRLTLKRCGEVQSSDERRVRGGESQSGWSERLAWAEREVVRTRPGRLDCCLDGGGEDAGTGGQH